VLIVKKSPPRDPRDPPYHPWRGLVHTNHTRCAESRNGCIQRISGPPSDPEIRHVALAAVPAANLGPGTRPEPAPTTHGEYGRNSTGGWLADDPRGVPSRPRTCGWVGAGFGVQEPAPNSSGGARAREHGVLDHRARQPPSGSCKLDANHQANNLFKILGSSFSVIGHSQATWSVLSMKYGRR
jgi:hypothetical protein